jgi:hypothetical protein
MAKTATSDAKRSRVRTDMPVSAVVAINLYLARYLIHLYRAFNGDMAEAIVLAEIAHHNVSGLLAGAGGLAALHDAVVSGRIERRDYLPTNAFSIAQATGIPRQTVRRKIEALKAKGWLALEHGGLVVTSVPYEHFREFNRVNIADFLETAPILLGFFREPGDRPRQQESPR